jgi:transglutaminase-like putative cysteine protease
MRKLAIDGKQWPPLRKLTLSLIQNLPPKDWTGEVRAIHAFVRDRIRYVRDVNNIETVHDVQTILQWGQGDCDDKSILLAAMLESAGHPARFVAVGEVPGEYSHVYVETKIGANWVPLETTMNWPMGKAPPGMVARMEVNI